jgi:hypothetical protein
VASIGRHTRSTPQFPLTTLEADQEKLIIKGKTLREGASTAKQGIFDSSHCPLLEIPISASQLPIRPLVGVSHFLNFGSVPVVFYPPDLGLEGERFVTLISPDVAAWSRPRNSQVFSTLSFTIPSPIIVSIGVPTPTSFLLSLVYFYSNPLLSHSPPISPPPNIPMTRAHPHLNRMDSIVATRYAPLILPHPMNPLPVGDYLKYMPKFTGEEDITVEENLTSFYNYENNLKIENEYV